MVCPEPGGQLGDLLGERCDADAQVRHESPDDRDRVGSAAPRIDEDLRVRARGQDQLLPPRVPDGLDRRRVVWVACVEERDDDTRRGTGMRPLLAYAQLVRLPNTFTASFARLWTSL